ncbi:MAG: M23 family metallopeptidase [Candidatus Mariimomonas ferrooxydans]
MSEQLKKSLKERLLDKFRLIIYNDSSFEEIWYIRLTRINIMILTASLIVLIVVGIFALVAFTGIRQLIPGYPDENLRRTIHMNAVRLDSLDNEIRMRDQYFQNIRLLVAGEEPVNPVNIGDTTMEPASVKFSKSIEDSLLRMQIEQEQYNLLVLSNQRSPTDLAGIHFFAPLRGLVTLPFNSTENHFGTDIVAAPMEVVKATLDGTVIMDAWTVETGYVIHIQHENNLISVYKHNSELLKKSGNIVKAGDAIAIIGNSGELTTGPHLHFELWHNGTAIDPQSYIVF